MQSSQYPVSIIENINRIISIGILITFRRISESAKHIWRRGGQSVIRKFLLPHHLKYASDARPFFDKVVLF